MAGDDWDQVCDQFSSECSGAGNTSTTTGSFTAELNTSASIFTGGGSKDPQNTNPWAWKDAGGLPDKDNLPAQLRCPLFADAERHTCPAGTAATCDILYFGSDRFDNSGDAQQGFWFFQNKVTLGNTRAGWRHQLQRRRTRTVTC